MLTIPANFGFSDNVEFDVELTKNGDILYTSRTKFPDIWNENPEDVLKFREELAVEIVLYSKAKPLGRENVDY